MKTPIRSAMVGIGRAEAKEIVKATEEKARRNGWNPDAFGTSDAMKRSGNLTDEEFGRYVGAKAIVDHTVDLDEGAVMNHGGYLTMLNTLERAAVNNCIADSGNVCVLSERFRRLMNSLSLHILTNAEKAIVPDAKKYVASLKTCTTRPVEIEATDMREAMAKAESLAGEGETVDRVLEV